MATTKREARAGSGAKDKENARERQASRRARRGAGEHSALGEKLIAGVPARIMRPRLVFLSCLAALLAFGLLMVYSASSVEALKETGSSTYYLGRQATFMAAGVALMLAASRVSLDFMRSGLMWGIWLGFLALLLAVLLVGVNVGGATRWIVIAGFQFQPSEFAKAVLILTAAKIFHEYYEEGSLDTAAFLLQLAVCVIAPLAAIILEPDMGTCLIIASTVYAMCYFAGFSYPLIGFIFVTGVLLVLIFVLGSSYRSARLFTASDPWLDPYGDGYQATLAIMAFASGGLFGRGIGNSTMKYNYLPEAHNDYILAIIGEELGFVGTLVFFALYLMMIYAAFKIAAQSPTVHGRLVAYGSAFMIMAQFLVNILGILGVTPMTGKTLPFISYGGSSMMAMLILAGLILRVSIESNPLTSHDARRAAFQVVREDAAGGVADAAPGTIEGSTAGAPRVRGTGRQRGFSVVDGAAPEGQARPSGRRSAGGAGERRRPQGTDRPPRADAGRRGSWERVDLGADPADRLRSRGVRTNYDGTEPSRDRRGRGRDRGRNSHDR
ncbi:putative lipid II flippase FtsW [Enorma burkinafasonensis]|uniref:putative lipid II flippase FtsW n=1 Tax=Enorma burkinafasonensis TaxID=2590867 RepID=UPI0011A039C7|nr:putative lipid II flippase FtsW [Enorma burkinafasonensis]